MGAAVNLNGYSGVFEDCEFNFVRGGTAIFSQENTNADYTFRNSEFYMGKKGGEKPAAPKGLMLINNIGGSIAVDSCTLIASLNPEGEAATTASSSLIINAAESRLRSLTVNNSTIALNAGAQNTIGINAGADIVTITGSRFSTNARNAKCIVVNGALESNISGNTFNIAQLETMGLSFTNARSVNLKNNIYNSMVNGTGGSFAGVAGSIILVDKEDIRLTDKSSLGIVAEAFDVLRINNSTSIKGVNAVSGSMGITANKVKAVEIENFSGINDETAGSSTLLYFLSCIDVEIKDCDFELYKSAVGISSSASKSTSSYDENGELKSYVSGDYEITRNNFYVGESAKAIFFGSKNSHNVEIYNNTFQANHSAGIVTVGYGRRQMVHDNIFEAVNAASALISDGVDETSSFSIDIDDDIYQNGEIVDDYRNQIYNNKLKGSFEKGFYITNNGDIIRNNDFFETTFNYESIPGNNSNMQVYVGLSKDVKILNNHLALSRAADVAIAHLSNAVLSEVTGNKTHAVNNAPQVLFADGSLRTAPNGLKYPENITIHNNTNTIDGMHPTEIVRAWNDPDNLIYQYILQLQWNPYKVEYYKDAVAAENLIAVEHGYTEFPCGYALQLEDIAADLGNEWLTLHRPAGYEGDIASNIYSLIIQDTPEENVVIVVYLPGKMQYNTIAPSVNRRAEEPGETYIEIDENLVLLAPPETVNPYTGKNDVLFLCIGIFISIGADAISFLMKMRGSK